MTAPVDLGREAFERRAWAEAYELLAAARSLGADDLERLAVAAHLAGKDHDSVQAWERAHLEHVRLGDPGGAARCAFWLGFGLLLGGEMAPAGGWLARTRRLVEDAGDGCDARGLLLVVEFLEALEGDAAIASTIAAELVEIGRRSENHDLLAFGLLCSGEASLALGHGDQGMAFLDEAMVYVTTGEVSPIPAGILYCAVIDACMNAFDLRRAAEWTDALQEWCRVQPELVAYRGNCLVHRSQVLQAHGSWTEALSEAEAAQQRLSEPTHPALGLALYQQGELHRLRGELAEAEQAYRLASQYGREPAPGFALLRQAEGSVDAAVAAISRMVDESRGRITRPAMLAAAVEIHLGAGDVAAARDAGDELGDIAATLDVPLLHATAAHAAGCVLLAEGDARAALAALRRACEGWRDLEMPYDGARTRVQIARACRALGDHDAATLELDAARAAFERLGARPDLARVEAFVAPPPAARPAPLTDRECEVLRLVAGGRTNREIAADLVISEHTVARHLQNIFTKLGLSSRSAATAYAYQHGLV